MPFPIKNDGKLGIRKSKKRHPLITVESISYGYFASTLIPNDVKINGSGNE